MVCPCRLWTTQSYHSDRTSQAFPHFPPPHMNLPVRSCYTLYGSRCTSSWEKVQGVRSRVYLANPWHTADIFSYRGRKSCTFMHQDDDSGNQQKVKGWSCICTYASGSTGFLITNLLEVRSILRKSGSPLLPSLIMYTLQEHHSHGFE